MVSRLKPCPKPCLNRWASYQVVEPKEAHLCCGSAGTYNLMQPELSEQLKKRKTDHLLATNPDVIATGNIGCMMQISAGIKVAGTKVAGTSVPDTSISGTGVTGTNVSNASISGTSVPTLHTIQLLDFATGGPIPNEIKNITPRIKIPQLKEVSPREIA